MNLSKIKWLAVVVAVAIFTIVLASFTVQWAYPAPAPGWAPQDKGPTITWSVTKLTGTMFPGTSSTTKVSFRSSENLTNVIVEVTPSLGNFLLVSPVSFASIAANQNYQLTFTLKAPSEFKKREFEGTIHVTDARQSSRTYAKPLQVDLAIDYATYSDTFSRITFNYPSQWTLHPLLNQPYFTSPPAIEVLEITRSSASGTPSQVASTAIANNKCPAVDNNNRPVDHIIAIGPSSVLFVLSCSATTEDYKYVFLNSSGELLELTYHDDFETNASESVKLSTFQQIINSLR